MTILYIDGKQEGSPSVIIDFIFLFPDDQSVYGDSLEINGNPVSAIPSK
jgi:hypothetical protein